MTVSNIDMDKRPGEVDIEDLDTSSKGRTESKSQGKFSSLSSLKSRDSE